MAVAARIGSEDERLLVASMDFGTTYSGCAFSFRSDFDKDPLSVSCINVKHGAKKEFQAQRVPTCILFRPDQQFHSFGFDARTKYNQLAKENRLEASKWYFFEKFKMELRLRETDLGRDLDLLDQTEKKTMKASHVITEAIRFLKNLLLGELQGKAPHVRASDMLWVLTVPAIWDDAARQFMREAAVKAGIQSENLRLALEPEVAAIFCYFHFMAAKEDFTEKGTRFMAVDCGGGTVDISVFKVAEMGRLEQLHKPHGAHCGGTKVDVAFWKLLSEILGLSTPSIDNMEMVELMENFEQAKEQMGKSNRVAVQLPESVKEAVGIHLGKSKYNNAIGKIGNKIRLPKDLYIKFFEESKTGIIEAMKEVLSSSDVNPVDVILLVGGLAKSQIIVDAVKAAFPDKRVLVPTSPDLTVLMGAVQFGHCPQAIATRVSPYTYGVSTTYVSRPEDDPSKKEMVDGVERTKDIFEVLIKVNERVSINDDKKLFKFRPTHSNQKEMKLDLYRTLNPDPKYVTDARCQKVASIKVDMPDTTGDKRRRVQVSLSVSGTELRVVTKDETTGREFPVTCDFLENKGKLE